MHPRVNPGDRMLFLVSGGERVADVLTGNSRSAVPWPDADANDLHRAERPKHFLYHAVASGSEAMGVDALPRGKLESVSERLCGCSLLDHRAAGVHGRCLSI